MKREKYLMIYHFLLMRIYHGFYPVGGYLPSIYILADIFNVSTMTSRKAIKCLHEQGYVTIAHGKRTMVVKTDVSLEELHKYSNPITKETLQDLSLCMHMILPSVFYHSLRNLSKGDLEDLENTLQRNDLMCYESVPKVAYKIVQKLHNPLLYDFFCDTILHNFYITIFRAGKNTNWQQTYTLQKAYLHKVIQLSKERQYEQLYEYMYSNLQALTDSQVTELKHPIKKPFQWRSVQKCDYLTSKIYALIRCGVYQQGSYLPSAAALTQQLSASLITTQRAIRLLNRLGIVASINGVGTRVLTIEEGCKKIQWTDRNVKKYMLLSMHSIHMIVLFAAPLAEAAFTRMKNDDIEEMKNKISCIDKTSHLDYVSSICLYTIANFTESEALVLVVRYLISLLVWGYPSIYLETLYPIDKAVEQIRNSLNIKDGKLFAQGFQQLMELCFQNFKTKLIGIGISEAQELIILS